MSRQIYSSARATLLTAAAAASAVLIGSFAPFGWAQVGPTTGPAASPTTRPLTLRPPQTAGRPAAVPTAPNADNANLVGRGLDENGSLNLSAGRSRVLQTSSRYSQLSVAEPTVADVNAIDPSRILVTGRKAGQTQIIVWNDAGQSQVIDVNVTADTAALQSMLGRLRGAEKVQVTETRGKVMLQGTVPTLRVAEQAQQLAGSMGDVVNFLEVAGGQQVMLHVVFAEVSRQATSSLGVNLGYSDGSSFAGSNIGQVSPLGIEDLDGTNAGVGLAVRDPTPAVTLFGVGRVGSTAIGGFLNALREERLLRVLAEPNLVAMSGEQASFLAGGEYPIPVVQGGTGDSTAVTIEFREFGVKLDFVAVALGDGKIRLKCMPEVSDLDFTTAVTLNGFVIPGLSQRRVNTTVELGDGQSLAIAGLLRNNVTAVRQTTPLLGDLPVLGTLFRSVRYQRQETELVVFVTPRLVAAVDPGKMPNAPGALWRHPTENDLFIKADIGSTEADPADKSDDLAPMFYGPFGFNRARRSTPVSPVSDATPAAAPIVVGEPVAPAPTVETPATP